MSSLTPAYRTIARNRGRVWHDRGRGGLGMRLLCVSSLFFLLTSVASLASCTSRNPARCCVTEAECAELGYPFPSRCEDGLACQATQCVAPTCSESSDCTDPAAPICAGNLCSACDRVGNVGCAPSAPVCNSLGDACEGCSTSDDCTAFADAPLCASSGACVQCISETDCGNPTPICDDSTCRACANDSECASGACAEDGTCAAEADIAYVASNGSDAGTCTRMAPCQSYEGALAQTTASRFHIVFPPGEYIGPSTISPNLVDRILHLHGYGATFRLAAPAQADRRSALFVSSGSLVISGLAFAQAAPVSFPPYPANNVIRCSSGGSIKLEDVHILTPYRAIHGVACAIVVEGSSIATNLVFDRAITLEGGMLTVHRSHVGQGGLHVASGTFSLTNNLFTTTGLTLDGNGAISFNTIADTTLPSGGARAVECSSSAPDRPELVNNIVWVPNGNTSSMIGGCRARDNIIGPVGTPSSGGNINSDPSFVDRVGGNYHLKAGSPAIDKASTGTPVDYDGDARPQGVAFDYGFDEVR